MSDLDMIYPKRKPLSKIMKGLLEELAELEHEQWRSWSKITIDDWLKNGKPEWGPEAEWIDLKYQKWSMKN